MTLRTRLTLVAAAAVAVSIVLVTVVVFYAERRELQLLVDGDLRLEAAAVAEQLQSTGEVDTGDGLGPFGATRSRAQVVTAGGEVIPLAGEERALPSRPQVLAVARGEADRFYADVTSPDGDRWRVLTVPLGDGALQVARSLEELDRHVVHVAWLLAAVTVGGLGLAVLLGRVVAGAALRPVARLTEGAERVAATQDLTSRLRVEGRDEMGRLAATLNTMLEALSRAHDSQRRLVADASHELRTPLATLRTNVEVLEAATDLPEAERRRIVCDLRSEIEGLAATVEDLLDLAREPAEEAFDDVDLQPLVERGVDWARRHRPDVRFITWTRPLAVRADAAALQRALGNLLDNAAKWTAPGTAVEVTLDDDGLAVRDHGPGIAEADLPRVFERFYRAPAARGRPGSGLGLAIVRQVADAHRWEVTASNVPTGGCVFRLRFRPDRGRDGRWRDGRWRRRDSSPVLSPRSLRSKPAATGSPHADEPSPTSPTRPGRIPVRSGLGIAVLVAIPLLVGLGLSVAAADADPRLRTMTGTLERCGPGYCVDGRRVDVGPDWYRAGSAAPGDVDGDGTVASWQQELGGLVGSRVTLETDAATGEPDVFTVRGLPLRTPDGQLPPPRPLPAGSSGQERWQERTRLVGRLQRCEGGRSYCVEGAVADFGPAWYLDRVTAPADLDGDGRAATVREELEGLVGERVRIAGLVGGDDVAVLQVNGVRYRDERAPPPWSGGPLRVLNDPP